MANCKWLIAINIKFQLLFNFKKDFTLPRDLLGYFGCICTIFAT